MLNQLGVLYSMTPWSRNSKNNTVKKFLLNFLKFTLFLGLGLLILYFVYNNQNTAYQKECALKNIPTEDCSLIQKVFTDFGSVNYFWIVLVLACFTVSNVSRAIRWNMLIRPLGYQPRFINAFFATVIGYFANLGLPRMGEVLRPATMAQYEKIPLEKLMGTVVVDRIIDVISILLVSGLAFLLAFDTIWGFLDQYADLSSKFGGIGNLLLIGSGGVAVVALLFWVLRKRLAATKLYAKIENLAKGFWQGLQTVRQLNKPWLFLFHSVNIWFMYFMMTYLCFFAFAPTAHLSPIAGLVVFVLGGWGVVIPSPGGMGTYHFLAQTGLMMYGIDGDDGFSWANIAFFSINLGCNVLIGIIALIALPIVNRTYHPQAYVIPQPD